MSCCALISAATSIPSSVGSDVEPTNDAQATMQLTLPAEVLATLTFSISAAVSKALLDVAQPLQSAAAAMTVPVWHLAPSAAAAAVPEVQFVPDPIPLSSSEVNRGLGLVEANPSSTNADQSVLKTVNNAVLTVSHKFVTT